MAKIAKKTRNLSVEAKLSKGTLAVQAAGAAEGQAVLGTPAPAELTALTDATAALRAAHIAKVVAEDQAKAATARLRGAVRDFDAAYTYYCGMAQRKTGGDLVKIGQVGLEAAAHKAPVGQMRQVLNLVANIGTQDGEVDLGWKPVRGAVIYIVQYCEKLVDETNWKAFGVTTRSWLTVTGLTSGQMYWFRVCAKGTAPGQGPWSDPAQKRAA